MRHITVIDGHPDPSEARLVHALADRYSAAARAGGNEVRRISLAHLHVPVLRSQKDFYKADAPESLRDAQRDIAWADHLVFFYPLWHGTMPALFKAFIEQTFRPGFAMEYGKENRFPKQLFKGKTARVIVTMGMPAIVYRTYFGAYGVKGFERSTLSLCGIGPVDDTFLGGAGGESTVRGAKWLDLMDELAAQDTAPEARRRSELFATLARAFVVLAGSYAAYVLAASLSKGWFRQPPGDGGASSSGEITAEAVPLAPEHA